MPSEASCHVTIREDYKPVLEQAYVSGRFGWHIKAPNHAEAARLLLEWTEKEDS